MNEMLQLQVNHMTILNSRYSRNKASHTFRFGTHEAELDYIMVRQHDANQQARLSAPVKDCPLGAWRHLGGYHVPIAASIREKIALQHKQTEIGNQIDREKIIACA